MNKHDLYYSLDLDSCRILKNIKMNKMTAVNLYINFCKKIENSNDYTKNYFADINNFVKYFYYF